MPEAVLHAMVQPTIGHLDPVFVALMDDIKKDLQQVFMTENPMTMAVSGPGSVGMEACVVNLVEPGDKVLVCRNGVFGDRIRENVERAGGDATVLDFDWGQPVDPAAVEQALSENQDIVLVAFVHAETSTGVLSDAQAIANVAQKHDCLVLMDAVTSLGGVPVKIDEWGIDAVYSGTQKCLSCPPGISPVSFSKKAMVKVNERRTPVQSWFCDMTLVQNYWSGQKRAYHHTAPINALYGLRQGLELVLQEGLENAWQRHQTCHQKLKQGLDELGLSLVVDEVHRLPQLNVVNVPDGINDAEFRSYLLEEHSLEIGAGLGQFAGKAWRIGLMGHTCREETVSACLAALKDALKHFGVAAKAAS